MKKLSQEALQNLKDLLLVSPHREKVYFKDNGEYLMSPQPGFDEVVTREEILGSETSADSSEEGSKKGKKK